ncbi:MAG: ammonia-forming cytochrome c nitrite reductase subunit c552 [Myxococcota bacterium]|nr:ammonia-forming cytochrome c nitrite reductase subunit c552 [Myxococcota bacterium]
MATRPTGCATRRYLAGLAALTLAPLAFSCSSPPPPAPTGSAAEGYAGSDSCRPCHEAIHTIWQGSAHYLNMARPEPTSVLGDFERRNRVEFEGTSSRLFREGPRYRLEYRNAYGETVTKSIDYVLGAQRQQILLHEQPDGRIQILPTHWSVKDNAWEDAWESPLDFVPKPIPLLDKHYWTGYARTFNLVCMECHASQPRKNYDPATNRYASTFDPRINCEACHGPAAEHVRRQQSSDERVRRADQSLIRLDHLSPQASIDVCVSCHAKKVVFREGFRPGVASWDYFVPDVWDTAEFHADGRRNGMVYNTVDFYQSACYRKSSQRMDCVTPCHPAHESRAVVRPVAEDNARCTGCHFKFTADLTAHTFHAPESAGSRCTSCHMPTFLVSGMMLADHTIGVPLPELSRRFGVPNACTLCHDHDSPEWSERWVNTWWGGSPTFQIYRARLVERAETLAGIFAAAEAENPPPLPVATLIRWLDDTGENIVQRASAASFLAGARDDPHALAALLRHQHDSAPLVRYNVIGALAAFAGAHPPARTALRQALRDRWLTIRGRAYEGLFILDPTLAQDPAPEVARVRAEYAERNTRVRADDPRLLSEMALWRLGRGELALAEQLLRQGLRLTGGVIDLRFQLLQLLLHTGRLTEAEQEVAAVEARVPGSLEAGTLRAQLLLVQGRPAEALRIAEGLRARGLTSELLEAIMTRAGWQRELAPVLELLPSAPAAAPSPTPRSPP